VIRCTVRILDAATMMPQIPSANVAILTTIKNPPNPWTTDFPIVGLFENAIAIEHIDMKRRDKISNTDANEMGDVILSENDAIFVFFP
jgi:hypothetical protein